MVKMIMELVWNRSFTLTTSNGDKSRLRRLKNGVPQGSVLAPLLYNIYTYDLPATVSRRFAYADDLALLHSDRDWQALEGTLSHDMETLVAYLHNWRLKLSESKTVTQAFHLYNREADREIRFEVRKPDGASLTLSRPRPTPEDPRPDPKYLGVTLDRSLTFRKHLLATRKKLNTRVSLLRRLVGSGWGAGARTLRTAALALVYSTAEYCAPVWARSAHSKQLDVPINEALRVITGCLRPTPVELLPILAGIQPAELRRQGAVATLAGRANMDENHLLHERLTLSSEPTPRLPSRDPLVPAALKLLQQCSDNNIRAAHWANHKWSTDLEHTISSRLRDFIPDTGSIPGLSLPRAAWVRLNRLRTGVGRFRSNMFQWGLAPNATCECGAEEQTADHVILRCPIYRAPNGLRGLADLDDCSVTWLTSVCPDI